MTFEVVTHNHNYPRLLAYQLSSLVLYPPMRHNIQYTLYCNDEDVAVLDTARFFVPYFPPPISLEIRSLPVPLLRNRAIGRNDAAKRTEAEWVWFADTDYMFLRTCWHDLSAQLSERPATRFAAPLTILETDWPTGDALIAKMASPALLDVDLRAVSQVRKKVAIGGLQIAHGPTVRQIGYCPELNGPRDKWDFRSDIRFRRQSAMFPQLEVSLDAVLRIRHSQRGYQQDNWEQVYN
jgi:hypothetical protein